MLTPKHAAILSLLCDDFVPGEVTRGAMLLGGWMDRDGCPTQKARDELRRLERVFYGEEDIAPSIERVNAELGDLANVIRQRTGCS